MGYLINHPAGLTGGQGIGYDYVLGAGGLYVQSRIALSRSGPACAVPFEVCLRCSVTIKRLLSFAMGQYLIVNGKFVEGNALQALV